MPERSSEYSPSVPSADAEVTGSGKGPVKEKCRSSTWRPVHRTGLTKSSSLQWRRVIPKRDKGASGSGWVLEAVEVVEGVEEGVELVPGVVAVGQEEMAGEGLIGAIAARAAAEAM